jgi:hypothetical protein
VRGLFLFFGKKYDICHVFRGKTRLRAVYGQGETMRKLLVLTVLVLACCLVVCTSPAAGGLGDTTDEGEVTDDGGEADDSGESASGEGVDDDGEGNEGGGEEPHVHIAGEWTITMAATCEEDGLKELHCDADGEVLETEPIPAIGHDWNEGWETISHQSETQDGIEAVTCRIDPSHIRETHIFAYATGTEGLAFELSKGSYKVLNTGNNKLSGTVHIPAFWRPKSDDDFDSYKPVAVIGSYVFASKENITGIVIPSGVTSIEQYAFYYCTGVDEITIPATVTKIGKWAFSGWGSAGPQTIVLPYATVEEAVSAWGTDWQLGNNAVLVASADH